MRVVRDAELCVDEERGEPGSSDGERQANKQKT